MLTEDTMELIKEAYRKVVSREASEVSFIDEKRAVNIKVRRQSLTIYIEVHPVVTTTPPQGE